MYTKNSTGSLLIFLLWASLSVPCGAQEENEPEAQTDTQTSVNEETTAEEISSIETVEPSDENFVPTQQISEDLSVSFPVDI